MHRSLRLVNWNESLTPERLFAGLCKDPSLFWLDTAGGNLGEAWSYLGIQPTRSIQVFNTAEVVLVSQGHRRTVSTDPFRYLASALRESALVNRFSADGPPLQGGWIGYFGYDCLKTGTVSNKCGVPLLSLHYFETTLAYSHCDRSWWISAPVSATTSTEVENELTRHADTLLTQFASQKNSPEKSSFTPTVRMAQSNISPSDYQAAVRRALEYISKGDIYQVNLSHRLSVPWEYSAPELYLRMRKESPAQYGAYLGADLVGGTHALCSISPELFLRVRGSKVVTRPIKGTRPRGVAANDARQRDELARSAKELAELNMIVDLERNDLGRVCEYGSVHVESAGEIEELPTLLHRVATVSGTLHSRFDRMALLKAAFPGGSVTGAPKIRAMQIIDELERSPRGAYCGAIGWLGAAGDMELSVAIRTALYDGTQNRVHYHAGSGIVADSDPQQEYEETLHKAAAFLRATQATLQQP